MNKEDRKQLLDFAATIEEHIELLQQDQESFESLKSELEDRLENYPASLVDSYRYTDAVEKIDELGRIIDEFEDEINSLQMIAQDMKDLGGE